MISETQAFALARRILGDLLESGQQLNPQSTGDPRNLSNRIGQLEQGITAAATVIGEAAPEASRYAAIAERILSAVVVPLAPDPRRITDHFARTLAARIGALEQAARAALVVLEHAAPPADDETAGGR